MKSYPSKWERSSHAGAFSGADGFLFGLYIFLLVSFPLVRGANRLWVLSIAESLCFLILALWLLLWAFSRVRVSNLARSWILPLVLWVCWLCCLVVQIIPLPDSVAIQYFPRQLALYQEAFNYTGETFQQVYISVSRGDSVLHLLETFSYFCNFLLVLLLVNSHKRLKLMMSAIVVSGVFQAAYGVFFLFSGLEVGWFFEQASPLKVATGTFVNRNHYGAYLSLCGATGIGLILSSLTSSQVSSWRHRARALIEFLMSDTFRNRIFVSVILVGLIFSRSRGANLAFFSALSVIGLLYVFLRERQLFLRAALILITFFLVDLWLVGNVFGVAEVVDRIARTSLHEEIRVVVFPHLLAMARDFWPLGSGLGSFYAVFPAYRPSELVYYFDHAHNDYMEFLIEVGVAAFFLAGLAATSAIRSVILMAKRKNRLVCGAAFASLLSLLVLGIHSTVDFNLQIPGIAFTLVAIMALPFTCFIQRESARVPERGASE
ncbi:O-antigen ligase family protein [Zhongshania aquimaris]|uniref:O-antigen ligase family protein n=1 Tax=Zhongshania aquimaris TaxID=2857107 RepID=A0ABS6VN30_9GAMM|nr:O-antigen ligase family protein [Zhongshania aquimaris]